MNLVQTTPTKTHTVYRSLLDNYKNRSHHLMIHFFLLLRINPSTFFMNPAVVLLTIIVCKCVSTLKTHLKQELPLGHIPSLHIMMMVVNMRRPMAEHSHAIRLQSAGK